MAFVYDTVRQDIFYIFNYIDSAIALAERHHQSVPCTCTVIAENPGEDDTRSILKAWSRPIALVNTSSVSHGLNENNLDLAGLQAAYFYIYLASSQGMMFNVKIIVRTDKSALAKHTGLFHQDKVGDPSIYQLKVNNTTKSCLLRQVREGQSINDSTADIVCNGKGEWHVGAVPKARTAHATRDVRPGT